MTGPKNTTKPRNEPEVSVLVANFNGERVLDACLDSVVRQKTTFSFEVIVHDDASTDSSAELIRTNFPAAKLIASEENVGFCKSNNRMAARARGRYLLLLNNDASLSAGALQVLYDVAERATATEILSLPQRNAADHSLVDRGCAIDPFFNPVPILESDRRSPAYCVGALLWISRPVWEQIGGFPEWLDSIGEDLYLCQAARIMGVRVRVLEAPDYFHEIGHSFGGGKPQFGRLSTTYSRRYLSERNKLAVLTVFAPISFLAITLPVALMLLFLEGLIFSVVKLNPALLRRIYLRSIVGYFRLLPRLVRERRSVRDLPCFNENSSEGFLAQINWIPRKLVLLLQFGLPEIRDSK